MAFARFKRTVQQELSQRFLPEGGIIERPRGAFCTDATAWGILAFGVAGGARTILEKHRGRLVHEQGEDGRVWLSPQHPESYWPTAIAILAWQDSSVGQAAQNRAIQFLLRSAGTHPPRKPDDPGAHDTALKGWSWIEDTHSWVEPTALGIMALQATGYSQHDRAREAVRMLLDRQLPHGGWNAGNTLVFGRELHPNPESTGAALTGLAGVVRHEKVARSINYLQGEVERLRTPISLGWSLLGLAAWDRWPSNGAALVERCLASQSRYGEYDTSALSLIFLGALAAEADEKFALFSRSTGSQTPAVLAQ
ncbi:prenyltransferase/squalene oxidase repeat-containing protein [Petrachloros mirabilis]